MQQELTMIRDLAQSDLAELKKMHDKGGIDFEFPDFSSPLQVNRIVSAVGGIIVAAGLHKICYETCVIG